MYSQIIQKPGASHNNGYILLVYITFISTMFAIILSYSAWQSWKSSVLFSKKKQFKFKTARNRHEKSVHIGSIERECQSCGKKSTERTIVRTCQNSTVSAYSENCFEINVNIFSLKQDESVLSFFQSKGKFSNVMYSNLFDNHLSHNSNFKAYARKLQCKSCKHHFDRVDK